MSSLVTIVVVAARAIHILSTGELGSYFPWTKKQLQRSEML
jgi:hypothetical protein